MYTDSLGHNGLRARSLLNPVGWIQHKNSDFNAHPGGTEIVWPGCYTNTIDSNCRAAFQKFRRNTVKRHLSSVISSAKETCISNQIRPADSRLSPGRLEDLWSYLNIAVFSTQSQNLLQGAEVIHGLDNCCTLATIPA